MTTKSFEMDNDIFELECDYHDGRTVNLTNDNNSIIQADESIPADADPNDYEQKSFNGFDVYVKKVKS